MAGEGGVDAAVGVAVGDGAAKDTGTRGGEAVTQADILSAAASRGTVLGGVAAVEGAEALSARGFIGAQAGAAEVAILVTGAGRAGTNGVSEAITRDDVAGVAAANDWGVAGAIEAKLTRERAGGVVGADQARASGCIDLTGVVLRASVINGAVIRGVGRSRRSAETNGVTRADAVVGVGQHRDALGVRGAIGVGDAVGGAEGLGHAVVVGLDPEGLIGADGRLALSDLRTALGARAVVDTNLTSGSAGRVIGAGGASTSGEVNDVAGITDRLGSRDARVSRGVAETQASASTNTGEGERQAALIGSGVTLGLIGADHSARSKDLIDREARGEGQALADVQIDTGRRKVGIRVAVVVVGADHRAEARSDAIGAVTAAIGVVIGANLSSAVTIGGGLADSARGILIDASL